MSSQSRIKRIRINKLKQPNSSVGNTLTWLSWCHCSNLTRPGMTSLEVWKEDNLKASCSTLLCTNQMHPNSKSVQSPESHRQTHSCQQPVRRVSATASPCLCLLNNAPNSFHASPPTRRSIPSSAAETWRAHPFFSAHTHWRRKLATPRRALLKHQRYLFIAHQIYDQGFSHLLTWMSPTINVNLMLITDNIFHHLLLWRQESSESSAVSRRNLRVQLGGSSL